jgi:hypothetical protein
MDGHEHGLTSTQASIEQPQLDSQQHSDLFILKAPVSEQHHCNPHFLEITEGMGLRSALLCLTSLCHPLTLMYRCLAR